MDSLIASAAIVVIGLLALLAIGLVLSRLYRRASKETAYVRTGVGGAKVILDGGALVLPVFHDFVPVSLRTHKLVVRRDQANALITNDNLRADVTVDFYVRVQREAVAIETATQTLGNRTNEPAALMELEEGKVVDALRSVAATMTLQQLHLHRADFVRKVRDSVNGDLHKNGLELESASLVGLDQTEQKHFNPQNTFDAAGLAIITRITEDKRRERFDVEATAEVAISGRQRDATRGKLNIERDTENAKLEQQRQIAEQRAATQAEVAAKEAEGDRRAREAKIGADRSVKERTIESETAIALRRQSTEAEIAKQSEAVSAAEEAAAQARARAVAAEEQVETARSVEVADRAKKVALVQAAEVAERDAISVTTAARAERESAEAKAQARIVEAQAHADAERMLADAAARRYEVDAEGQRRVNEARNILEPRMIDLEMKLRLIEGLPAILAAATKPMEKIDSIRIMDMNGGLGGHGPNDAASATGLANGGNLAQQAVDAALQYQVTAPMVQALLNQIGITDARTVQGFLAALGGGSATAPEAAPTPPAALPPMTTDRALATAAQ